MEVTETKEQETGTQGKEGMEQTQGSETKKQGQEKTEGQKVDVEKERKGAVADYLSGLGVDDKTLKEILAKHKEEEDKNKTELERKEEVIKETTAQLAEEKRARMTSDAKVIAMQSGVNPKLVEDFIIVAMSKVTKDKDIAAVVAEMKESESGKIYFLDESSEEQGNHKNNKGTVTRKRVQSKSSDNEKEKEGGNDTDSKYEGTMAQRIFSRRAKSTKSHYFGSGK